MFSGLELEYKEFQNEFSNYYENYFTLRQKQNFKLDLIWQSMRYSFDSGGKRFRPFLSYLVAKTFLTESQKISSIALACEMVHTYSLIHDDLPCMDNDDFRRGIETNHRKFGEDVALLAGDALQAEAVVVGEGKAIGVRGSLVGSICSLVDDIGARVGD